MKERKKREGKEKEEVESSRGSYRRGGKVKVD